MGGSTRQNDQAEFLNSLLNQLYTDIQTTNFQAPNRFDTYAIPYEYEDMSKQLAEYYNMAIDSLRRDAASNINRGQQQTAEALASQGITGGAVLNNALNKVKSDINKSKYGAITDLRTTQAGQEVNLMDLANKNRFDVTSAAQNVDLNNRMNLFRQYGMLLSNTAQQGANISNLNNKTIWDDILAGLNTIGNVAGATLPFLSGGSGVTGVAGGGMAAAEAIPTAAAVISDIRYKENIKKVGTSPMGVNIYEFNYKGIPGRYRGAIAQENPEASINVNGVLYLDYSKLDVEFTEV